jgi:hemerythrin superfamily protein
MDAIRLLELDHRHVESLFESYRMLRKPDERNRTARQITRELSMHAAIEELRLYPAIRRRVVQGNAIADQALREHRAVKEALARLEDLEASDAEFDRLVARLERDVRRHVSEEEGQLFPRLRAVFGESGLADLGTALEKAKKLAPTHPHPYAPARVPANVIAAPAAFDRARGCLASASRRGS